MKLSFASQASIETKENGRAALAYTEKEQDGSIHITVRSDFGRLYEGTPKSAAGRDYSKVSPQDERAAIIAHEGTHAYDFKNGLTQQQYGKNPSFYENRAFATGKLVNKAFGSESIYDVE